MRAVYLGCDPDMSCPTVAAVCADTGEFVGVWARRRPKVARGGESSAIVSIRNVRGIFQNLVQMLDHPKVLGIAVENQEVVSSGQRGVPPSAILSLGQVAGALLSEALHELRGDGKVLFPMPHTWKGGVPKQIHQARVLGKLGLGYEQVGKDYCIPLDCEGVAGFETLNRGDWKHACDSLGLAVWCKGEMEQR